MAAKPEVLGHCWGPVRKTRPGTDMPVKWRRESCSLDVRNRNRRFDALRKFDSRRRLSPLLDSNHTTTAT
jgi:hypothetical protein